MFTNSFWFQWMIDWLSSWLIYSLFTVSWWSCLYGILHGFILVIFGHQELSFRLVKNVHSCCENSYPQTDTQHNKNSNHLQLDSFPTKSGLYDLIRNKSTAWCLKNQFKWLQTYFQWWFQWLTVASNSLAATMLCNAVPWVLCHFLPCRSYLRWHFDLACWTPIYFPIQAH